MIDVLVVEDNSTKAAALLNSVEAIDGIDRQRLIIVSSSTEAQRALEADRFDAAVIDICLPRRFGDEARTEEGIELLKKILRKPDRYRLPRLVVGVTTEETTYKTAAPFFQERLWPLLLRPESDETWKISLQGALRHLISVKSTSPLLDLEKPIVDVAIVCALAEPELKAAKKVFGLETEESVGDDPSTYFRGQLMVGDRPIRIAAAAADQMGLPAAAALTTKMLYTFAPRFVLMTGIAGGVKGKVELGDVVIANPCWSYGFGKKVQERGGEESFLPEPLQERLPPRLVNLAQKVKRDPGIVAYALDEFDGLKTGKGREIHVGAFASGEAVIASKSALQAIASQNRRVLAVDMEAYGVMYAGPRGPRPGVDVIVAKGISDFADPKKGDSVHAQAAYVSAAVGRALVEHRFANT